MITKSAKESIPQVTSYQPTKHHGNIWWNDSCESARIEKWKSYKKYLKTRTEIDLLHSKQAKNHANRIIDKAKRDYWNNLCTNDTDTISNPQKVWTKIKEMKKGIFTPSYPIHLLNNDLPSNTEKAEAFAESFANNSRLMGLSDKHREFRLHAEKDVIQAEYDRNQNKKHRSANDINSPISLEELLEQVQSLNNKKSSVGLDGISNKMPQHIPRNKIVILLDILNKCWLEGKLPSVWKKSIVIPIHKPGKSKKEIKSYRPIALTSHM